MLFERPAWNSRAELRGAVDARGEALHPTKGYLDAPTPGFSAARRGTSSIEPIAGRLPSQVLGLHLERDGEKHRLVDPATAQRLLTRLDGREAADRRAEAAEVARQRLDDENEGLRR